MDGAVVGMGAFEIACAHEEFIDDLAAGEAEGFFEEFHPFFLCFGVMVFEPFFERAEFFLDLDNGFGIFDGGVDLEAVPDDAGVGEQPFAIFVSVGSDFFDVEIVIGFAEAFFFFQDGLPAETGLVDLHDQSAKQFVIVMDRESIMMIVVFFV